MELAKAAANYPTNTRWGQHCHNYSGGRRRRAPVTLESFYSLWNDTIYFSSIDWDNWEDDEEDDWDDDWEDDWDYGYYDDWDYGYEDWDYDEDWDEDPYNG